MPELNPTDVALSNIATATTNNALVYDRIMPSVAVPGPRFEYRKFDRNWKVPDSQIDGNSRPDEGQSTSTLTPENVNDYGLIATVSLQEVNDQNSRGALGVDVRAQAVEDRTQQLLLDRERGVFNQLNTASTGITDISVAAADRWDATTGNPVKGMRDALRMMKVTRGDTLVVNQKQLDALSTNQSIQDAVYHGGSQYGFVPVDMLAGLLGIRQVVLASVYYDSSAVVGTENLQEVYDGTTAFLLKAGAPGTVGAPSDYWGFTAIMGGRTVTTDVDNMIGTHGVERAKIVERRKEIVLNTEAKVRLLTVTA